MAPEPLPEIQVSFTSDDHGVDMLAKQIRITGRAFPLFDIAQLILAKPERHCVTLSIKKKPDGTPVQPLLLCALDDTLWLSEDDAVRHVLDKHFSTFYQAERIKIDPPKGVYTFVAQCGISGVILGPPNYHDYQNQLRKLHAERFARMPFEAFKGMKDDDIKDIFAFLRSLPPVKHRVSNTDPPAKCEVCGQTHGLGELNKK